MESVTRHDIPAVVLALVGGTVVILGTWMGLDTVVTTLTKPNHSSWVGYVLLIAGVAVIVGSSAILVSVWSVQMNNVKRPTAILSGILAYALFRLAERVELFQPPRRGYDEIHILSILVVPVLLVWVLLWYVERRWNMSYSQ